MAKKRLTHDVLMRLTGQALITWPGCAERFEGRLAPGMWMALANEPVADLNYLVVNSATPQAMATLGSWIEMCDDRELPFAVMLGPDVSDAMTPVVAGHELTHAVAWPLMICPASAAEDHPVRGVDVQPLRTENDAGEMAVILAEAFSMPLDSVRRAVPRAVCEPPGIDVYLARSEGRALATLTVTRHDPVVGIWAMGTLPETQGRGVGKALLSRVLVDQRERGAETFFLGATPAGQPLYRRLGFERTADAQVWVRGVTHQA